MGENNGEGYKGYKQTTKLHFRYASHVAFRYKTDCETRFSYESYVFLKKKSL